VGNFGKADMAPAHLVGNVNRCVRTNSGKVPLDRMAKRLKLVELWFGCLENV
jgi:hypothetical protein